MVTSVPLSAVCRYRLVNEEAMTRFGTALATRLPTPALVTLRGELGAGKSVLARAIVHALGFSGAVKSPTYTLIETYQAGEFQVAHLDLYRLATPEELLDVGFSDLLSQHDVVLIEWPEQAGTLLPPAELAIDIGYHAEGRELTLTRGVNVAMDLTDLQPFLL